MAVAVLPPQQGYLKLGKETTRGTAAATLVSIDADSRSLKGRFTRIKPRSLNNSVHELLEIGKGRQSSGGDIAGKVRSDTIGQFLMAVYGQDTVTGTGPYTHTFAVAASTPSYTAEKNIGGLSGAGNSEQYLNLVCDKLVISGQPEQDDDVLQYVAGFIGKAPTKIATSAYTKPAQKVIPSALTAFSYGGVNTLDVLTAFQFTFERVSSLVKGANNTVDISDAVGTIFKVSGFIEAYWLNFAQFYDDLLANTEKAITVTTALSASESLALTTTGAYFDDHDPQEGGELVKQRLNFDAIYKSADSGAAKAVLVNGTAGAY